MTLYQQTRALLAAYGIRPSKARGQSFMIDANMSAYIARQATADGPGNVLEIGPGLGSLTKELLPRTGRLLAVEKDAALAAGLRERFKDDARLQVECANFLTLDLEPYLREGGPWRVVANLPYSITTPILFRLFDFRRYFDLLFLTLQKEVAQRLVAPSGTKEYGALSIAIQMWSEVKVLRLIPPDCFFPRPKVTSALVRFGLRSEPAVPVSDMDFFEFVSRGLFQHRRKQLANSLAFIFSSLDKGAIRSLLTDLGISPTARPEELSLSDLSRLTTTLGSRLLALGVQAPGFGAKSPKPRVQSLKPQ